MSVDSKSLKDNAIGLSFRTFGMKNKKKEKVNNERVNLLVWGLINRTEWGVGGEPHEKKTGIEQWAELF